MNLITKGNVETTHQAFYVDKKHKAKTKNRVEIASKLIPFLKTKLNFASDVKIIISFIKAKNTAGMYQPTFKYATIDPRMGTIEQFIDCLCHELVHAEQYHTGMLSTVFDCNEGTKFVWNKGQPKGLPYSHAKYLALPWEVDARTRAKELVKEIQESGILGTTYLKQMYI